MVPSRHNDSSTSKPTVYINLFLFSSNIFYTRWCPPAVVSRFIIPLSIDISIISPSYWSYKPTQLPWGHHLVYRHQYLFNMGNFKKLITSGRPNLLGRVGLMWASYFFTGVVVFFLGAMNLWSTIGIHASKYMYVSSCINVYTYILMCCVYIYMQPICYVYI